MAWGRMDGGRLLLEIGKAASAEEFKARMLRIAEALILKQRGVDEWADQMLSESEEAKNRWEEAGKASGEARRRRARTANNANNAEQPANKNEQPANNANDVPNNARTTNEQNSSRARVTDKPTYRQTDKPTYNTDPIARGRAREDGPSGSVVGDVPSEVGVGSESDGAAGAPAPTDDAYSEIGGTPDERLPDLAVVFCRESDPTRALNEYRKAMKEMEPWRFRILLDQFIGDCKEDEPRSRGKVFMSRIMETLKELRDRRRQENALAVPR